jgi:hypothetical protein
MTRRNFGCQRTGFTVAQAQHRPFQIMPTLHAKKFLICLAAISGCLWMLYLVDDGLGIGWTDNVVRNWEDFGFFHLHGQLVMNPGGFEIATNPVIYPGHRAMSLYPVFICTRIFAGSIGFFLYYTLISIVVFASINCLLGKGDWAFLIAATVMICPGYVRWQTVLDPNVTSVLLGFPYSVMALSLLKKPGFGAVHFVLLVILILAFTTINWTTAFVHFSLLVTILLTRIPWRRLIIYVAASGLVTAIILTLSLASKLATGQGKQGDFMIFLQGYTWGNIGYGAGLTTRTAFLRMAFVNLIGLLPLLLLSGWEYFRNKNNKSISMGLAALPLVAIILEIASMRNYFGHHPWMSVPFITFGIILGLYVWTASAPDGSKNQPAEIPGRHQYFFLTVSLAYAVSVIFLFRIHNANELSLVKLIRGHTARSDLIVIASDRDSETANLATRLPPLFDRNVVVVRNLKEWQDIHSRNFLLSASDLREKLRLTARNARDPVANWPLLQGALHWYSKNFARRNPGDKMSFPDTYYLYEQSQ